MEWSGRTVSEWAERYLWPLGAVTTVVVLAVVAVPVAVGYAVYWMVKAKRVAVGPSPWWRKWWAWFPVQLSDEDGWWSGQWVWGVRVERQQIENDYWNGPRTLYRRIGE